MPIVNDELVAELSLEWPQTLNVPTGLFLKRIIEDNLAKRGDSHWLTDITTGKSLKYGELLGQIELVAANLHLKGLKRHDVVLIMASNQVEMAVFFLAVWRAGGCNAGLVLNLLPEHIRSRAVEVGAKFILTDMERAPHVLEAVESLESIKEVFVIGQMEKCTSFDQLLMETQFECPKEVDIDQDSACWLLYSSGTTGTPKAIVHTQRNVNRTIYTFGSSNTGRRLLFHNSLVNPGGMFLLLNTTAGHGQLYTMSESCDEDLLMAIDRVKPEIVSLFPPQIVYFCRHPNLDKYDLSSVAIVTAVGGCMNPFYEEQLYDKFPNLLRLVVNYAMTEAMVIATSGPKPTRLAELNPTNAKSTHVIGTVGRLTPGNRLKIVDPDTGGKLGPNQVGEICVKTPYLMKEYFNRPDATAETLIDGWLHTGDQGYYDSSENVFVVGRYKELIKYRMTHVLPTNIEKHLLTHPAVEDAAVIGRPDDLDGELPTAFVVVKAGHSLTAEELLNYVDDRLLDEEKLRGGIRFTGQIPRNDMRKIVRHQLVQMLH